MEEGSTVAIYGAGYCNDIDLRKLSQKASHITLIDVNGEALTAACSKYGLTKAQVSAKITDLLPIPDRAYAEYAGRCLSLCTHNDKYEEAYLISALEATYEKYFGSDVRLKTEDLAQYDYTVVLGLHSQLNNIFSAIITAIDAERGVTSAELLKKVEKVQRKYFPQIVSYVTKRILSETVKSMLLGYEVEAWSLGKSLGAVEGAVYIPDVITGMCSEGLISVPEVARTTWPFSQKRGIEYEMEVLTCSK